MRPVERRFRSRGKKGSSPLKCPTMPTSLPLRASHPPHQWPKSRVGLGKFDLFVCESQRGRRICCCCCCCCCWHRPFWPPPFPLSSPYRQPPTPRNRVAIVADRCGTNP